MTKFIHHPVLLNECIKNLEIKPNGVYVDGTIGGGGHASAIAKNLGQSGLLIGIDRDGDAIAAARERLESVEFGSKKLESVGLEPVESEPVEPGSIKPETLNAPYKLVRDKYENMRQVLQNLKISAVDGFLLDLGVSSYQLDTPERGFSYRYDAPLDMRMDDRASLTGWQVVNGYSEKELAEILKNYGEERYARRIARAICNNRSKSKIESTLQLAQIVADAQPGRPPKVGHPAMRTFQAIRIEVNSELIGLKRTIEDMAKLLAPGGRICIITFHSLEDRIVKQAFKQQADPCDCPKDMPYCVCKKIPTLSIITKKPIKPNPTELETNPRAHSAKLRVASKL